MRQAEVSRKTKETNVFVSLNLDGTGRSEISTTVGFFDHMLELFTFHGGFDLKVQASGDTHIDDHHLVEDVGIVLGRAFFEAAGERIGIKRYSHIILPMDEALVMIAVDLATRSHLGWDVEFKNQFLGTMNSQNIFEFFKAFVDNAKLTVHIKKLSGLNDHHVCEVIFKGFGRVLKDALQRVDERASSTKGVL